MKFIFAVTFTLLTTLSAQAEYVPDGAWVRRGGDSICIVFKNSWVSAYQYALGQGVRQLMGPSLVQLTRLASNRVKIKSDDDRFMYMDLLPGHRTTGGCTNEAYITDSRSTEHAWDCLVKANQCPFDISRAKS